MHKFESEMHTSTDETLSLLFGGRWNAGSVGDIHWAWPTERVIGWCGGRLLNTHSGFKLIHIRTADNHLVVVSHC